MKPIGMSLCAKNHSARRNSASFRTLAELFLPSLLACANLAAESPVLIPRLKPKHVGSGPASYKVDRVDDHYGGGRGKTKQDETESLRGTIVETRDEFECIRVRKDRGGDVYLSLQPGCLILKDEALPLSSLAQDDPLILAGELRGYVAGLPVEQPPRWVLGARFIFRIKNTSEGGEETEPDEGEEKSGFSVRQEAGLIAGLLTSIRPLVLKDADGALYEIRPVTNCRAIEVRTASAGELEKGMALHFTGHREKVTLRPKGRTLTRYVFETDQVRMLSSELAESEYRQILRYEWGR